MSQIPLPQIPFDNEFSTALWEIAHNPTVPELVFIGLVSAILLYVSCKELICQ